MKAMCYNCKHYKKSSDEYGTCLVTGVLVRGREDAAKCRGYYADNRDRVQDSIDDHINKLVAR